MKVHAHGFMMEVRWVVGCLVMLVLAGCAGGSEVGNPTMSAVSSFDSAAELEGYLKEQLASNIIPRNALDAAPTTDAMEGGGYSATTVQESGVDESDMVKTDGTHLYIARTNEVVIVRKGAADPGSIAARIPVSGTVESLYLEGDLLVILSLAEGSYSDPGEPRILIGMPSWMPSEARTGVLFYDVSNPGSPRRLKEVELDGSLVSTRLTSGRLHVVQQYVPLIPALDGDYNGTASDQEATVERNTESTAALTLADLIPSYTVIDSQGISGGDLPLVTYDRFYRPAVPEGGSIVTITTFRLEEGGIPFESIGFVGDTHTVYASTSALYLIANVYDVTADATGARTLIHRFALDDLSDISSGTVRGWIVNQFSLGEHDGVLRVATTEYSEDFSNLTNSVFCLEPRGAELEVIGSIEDITPGERIYSARFTGERGYLVTFVQVDPLITLDLSDPASPAIAGELILPGYSTYIHPLDDDTILTLGMNTLEESGMVLNDGVQLSVFDVSDFAEPVLMDRVTIGDRGTGSEALWNHKAFTFHAEGNLIAFPVDLYEDQGGSDPWTWGTFSLSGLYVYRLVEGAGFDFLGTITTQTAEDLSYGSWTRGVFIGTGIFAVNADVLQRADVEDIASTVKSLSLDE